MPQHAALLVVEDDPDSRDMLTRRLQRQGHAVTAVEDGGLALDALARGPFDLVILDLLMPGLSGLDVLRAIRLEHSPRELPVIMVTARTDSEDVVAAMSLGATDYVAKPVDFPVLLARIEAQLRLRAPQGDRPAPPLPVEALGVGAVLEGRYAIEGALGQGGFSVVYRARQITTGQEVAVKLLRPDRAGDAVPAAELGLFRREMEVIGRLRHPHIVRLIDWGVLRGGHPFTVLELVEGETLAELVARQGPLAPEEARRLLLQVLEALSCAHRAGVVHLDLKPQNVMVVSTGFRRSALVLDFGLAAIADAPEAPGAGLRGTPSYIAPERLRREPVTGQADLYAWGLMLLEALTGEVAMRKHTRAATVLQHLRDDPVPIPAAVTNPDLRQVIARAAAKRPADRFASADEAIAALEAARIDPGEPALPAPAPPTAADTATRDL